jgi:hypothetical protein
VVVFQLSFSRLVAFSAGGEGGRRSLEFPAHALAKSGVVEKDTYHQISEEERRAIYQSSMKPSAFRIERLLAKVEAEVERRGLRARRYVFHPDEVAEAEAQGLPYVLLPRVLRGGNG